MFDIDSCVAFITKNATKVITDAFTDQLSALGITRVQWTALYYLGRYQSLSQTELADKMHTKDSSIARLIDRMERDGYVERVRLPEDRRVSILKLTENGLRLWEEVLPEGEKFSQILSYNLTEEEFQCFKRVLDKMMNNLRGEK